MDPNHASLRIVVLLTALATGYIRGIWIFPVPISLHMVLNASNRQTVDPALCPRFEVQSQSYAAYLRLGECG